MKLRNLLLIGLIFLFIASCGKKEEEVIKLGAVLAMTGESGLWGQNLKTGMELAISEINHSGGILGRKVVIVYEDTKSNSKDAVNALYRVINLSDIECIMGDALSSNTLAMAPICERNKKVLLNFCVASELSYAGDYIFRNWNSAVLEAKFISSFVKKSSKKLVVLFQNDSYGISLKNELISGLDDSVKIVYSGGFDKGTTDFRGIIAKFLNLNYDGIYLSSYYEEALKLLRKYKEMNGKKVNIYGVSEWDEKNLKEFISMTYPNLVYYPYPLPPDSTLPIRKRFLEGFREKYSQEPLYLSDNGYDAVYQIKYGIEKAGIYNSTKVKDALYSMKDFQGASGIMSFDSNGDVHKPYGLKTFNKEGEYWFNEY